MKQSGLGGRARSIGWKLALVAAFTPGAAWAQDYCDEDSDCGHGFQCLQTSANSSSVVTGSGGSSQVECGDGICEGGVEDPDSCPTDCETISYCAPAECDSNSDCAEGYECGEEVGANSGFTSAGGSTASVCGDDTCDIDENNDNCAEDCPVFRYCQPEQTQCSSDADCADGFYCYLESGTNDVGSVSVSSVDSATNGSDTATDGSSGSSDSDSDSGSDGADSGFAPPADTSGTTGGDEVGVCVVESSDGGSSSGNSGSSVNTASGPTDSSAAGDDTGSSAANNNGAGGASTAGGEVIGSNGDGTGTDGETGDSNATGNASGSDGGGAGGSDPDAGGGDGDGGSDDGGCSCSVVGAPASSGLLAALLLGVAAGVRRRRTRS